VARLPLAGRLHIFPWGSILSGEAASWRKAPEENAQLSHSRKPWFVRAREGLYSDQRDGAFGELTYPSRFVERMSSGEIVRAVVGLPPKPGVPGWVSEGA